MKNNILVKYMDKEKIELLRKEYAPIIKKIINDNTIFYRFTETIKWCFGYNDDAAIMGSCNRNTNVISINLKSVERAMLDSDLKTIEYYLLHEIRHAFQHSIIKDYKDGKEVPIDAKIIEKWIYECSHYINIYDNNGNENVEYFLQDSEMDAYAYAFAVMKYKYCDTSKLFVSSVYGKEFYDIVDEWIDKFKEEGL